MKVFLNTTQAHTPTHICKHTKTIQTNLRNLAGFFEIFPKLSLMHYIRFKTTRYISKYVNVRYMNVYEGGKAQLQLFWNWEL